MKLTDRPNFEEFNSAMHSSHMVFNGITYIRADIVDELAEELKNIANANPAKWDEDTRDQFQQWAQNRARVALAKARGEG